LSYFCAYSFGTGTEIGIASAPASAAPVPFFSLKTIVWSSGVSIPGISWYFPPVSGAPTRSEK
jgi:hypothetical protein